MTSPAKTSPALIVAAFVRVSRGCLVGCVLAVAAIVASGTAHAQIGAVLSGSNAAPVSPNDPVTFQADRVGYDRDGALIVATGHVQAWQGGRELRADRVTFDRNTNVAAASGNVVLIEPDGQTLFSQYAELTQGMRDAVLRDMRAQLAENGRLAANGARRLEARTNELSRAIYSTCNVCAQHPENAPLWDIRALSAVQDLEKKRIEYHDATIDLYGYPVAYFPYLSTPDPSTKRATGFLVPSIGNSSHLGAFTEIPYYIVIDDQQDATVTPLLATSSGPALFAQYRLRLNEGTVLMNGSIAYDQNAVQGHIFAKGQFAWDDTWRYGFDINRASSAQYFADYRISNNYGDVLTSQLYIEGFGQGSYTRLDARAYQGLTTSIVTSQLPYVLPRYTYSFVGEPDALGGRTSIDTTNFNVTRDIGTNDQRASLRVNWERPFSTSLGDLYKLVLHVDSAAYSAASLDQQPNFLTTNSGTSQQAMPTVALEYRWPFLHDGEWGTQVVEPIAQVIAAPNGSSYALNKTLIPNEDSLDVADFTDANLFALNRFPGVDRLEGGNRVNVALHANWSFAGGTVDGLIGQGYREKPDKAFPVGSGLTGTATDVVSHVSYQPNKYFDFTTRQRFNHANWDLTYADAVAGGGLDPFRLSVGYIYSSVSPYTYYNQTPTGTLPGPPRNEVTLNANAHFGNYRFNTFVRRDLETAKMVGVGAGGAYEDECFIFDVRYYRRFTSVNNDSGDTTILFTVTLKTVGQFGFHAT